MKNILCILLLVFIASCTSITPNNNNLNNSKCPEVFFSSEQNQYVKFKNAKYILDEAIYSSKFNNFKFNENCISNNKFQIFPLDILFVIKHYTQNKIDINFPIFVLLFDKEDNLIDTQYFNVSGTLEDQQSIDIELIERIRIITKSEVHVSHLVFGFINSYKEIENLD